MERKLVKQGRNALTITLPSEWIKMKNLTFKDVVTIKEEKGNLIVSTNKEKLISQTQIDVSKFTEKLVLNTLIGAYIKGYDKIVLLNPTPFINEKANELYLLGMIIEEQTDKKIIFSNIISKPENNFEEIFKRSCILLVDLSRKLILLSQEKIKPEEIKKSERILDQNLFYCLRYINKYRTLEESHKLFLLIATIEQIADNISYLRKYINNNEILATKITKLIEIYVQGILIKDYNKISLGILEFRETIEQKNFAQGYAYSITDTMINYLGYLINANY